MRFLFHLDLSLHAGAGKKFGILNFESKHGLGSLRDPLSQARLVQNYSGLH